MEVVKKKQASVQFTEKFYSKLASQAFDQGISVADLIRQCVFKELKKDKKKNG